MLAFRLTATAANQGNALPPPPPPPRPPPPPPPPPQVPRDEIVTSLDNGGDKKKKGDDDVLVDLSQLGSDDGTEIDSGVTSGADSGEWDPISVDNEGRSEGCYGQGSASGSGQGTPGTCGVKQQ